MTNSHRRGYLALLIGINLLVLLSALSACQPAYAAIPDDAQRYQRTLIRTAHAHWGLDAPVATFAAQIHQESAWRPSARSPTGAEGLAQFMPATSAWFAQLHPRDLGTAQPYNPAWAMRAMVLYNRWLHPQFQAATDCDHWAMTLAAYNGGQGWVARDKALASASGADPLVWFDSVERYNAGRSAANFRENRDYPRRILLRWQPLYERHGWGRGVDCRCIGEGAGT